MPNRINIEELAAKQNAFYFIFYLDYLQHDTKIVLWSNSTSMLQETLALNVLKSLENGVQIN